MRIATLFGALLVSFLVVAASASAVPIVEPDKTECYNLNVDTVCGPRTNIPGGTVHCVDNDVDETKACWVDPAVAACTNVGEEIVADCYAGLKSNACARLWPIPDSFCTSTSGNDCDPNDYIIPGVPSCVYLSERVTPILAGILCPPSATYGLDELCGDLFNLPSIVEGIVNDAIEVATG